MATGKMSPRQKMINLMYLVFIAMMAMNMSKEVLSAFGILKDKITLSIQSDTQKNNIAYNTLNTKASEQPAKYAPLKEKADKIRKLSSNFYNYLEDLKTKMTAKVKDPKDYEKMDRSSFLDELFFKGDGFTKKGKQFLSNIKQYREGVIRVLDGYDDVTTATKERFKTDKVTDREGIKKSWLNYHYEGFPMVASLTNITQMQADIKITESEALSVLMQGQLNSDVSLTKYDAIVIFDKNAYYPGEKLSGKIILGRNDPTLRAEKVILNGKEISQSKIEAGQVLLDDFAGNVGDHSLKGNFFFKENDSLLKIPIIGSYAVIPKPNEAVVSADKMNVVYRGVSNPLTISIPGIPSNKIKATAAGLKHLKGSSYMMNPGAGKMIAIKVSGNLPDGGVVNTSKTYRIKDIPPAMGMIRGQFGTVSLPRGSLKRLAIAAGLSDFLFDLKLQVTSFKVKVPGQLAVKVNGTHFNRAANRVLGRAVRGDIISIFDIKAKVVNNSYQLKKVLPVNIKVVN